MVAKIYGGKELEDGMRIKGKEERIETGGREEVRKEDGRRSWC